MTLYRHLLLSILVYSQLLDISIFATEEMIPYHVCSLPMLTRYQVDQVDMIQTNDGYEISLYGIPQMNVDCGHLFLSIRSHHQKEISETFSLCDFTKCPLVENEASVIKAITNQTLLPGRHRVQIRMDSSCRGCANCGPLGCVVFSYVTS
jgi:hypothetical protein